MHSDNETVSERISKTFVDAMLRLALIAFLLLAIGYQIFMGWVDDAEDRGAAESAQTGPAEGPDRVVPT